MSMLIQIKDLSLHYGTRVVLDEANVTFSKGQKIAVIGRNGAGKSTLCKLILEEMEPDEGSIQKSYDLHLSYLEQKDPFKDGETVQGFLERYSGKETWECDRMAHQFGLKYEQLENPITSLSGGYQMRVKLAGMLLKEPNFLILDEPTNYLDLNTLLFLERFLQDFDGTFLVVSHDREFLKKTCEYTLEIENGKTTLYKGGIEDYFEFKAEQIAQKEAHNKSVDRQKKHLQSFIDRFGSKASKAASAQSKRKQIERLKTVEIENPLSTVKIRLPQIQAKNGPALQVSDMAIGYPEKRVAGKITLSVDKGKHVAILGDNGQGKSTFLKTIAEEIQPISGSYKWSATLTVGYYAQHVYKYLDENDSVLDALEEMADTSVLRQEILDIAGSFLFKGDEVRKKIKVLSGGERARVCLAGLLLSKSDVLLLDEPTNHLDFETVEALAGALQKYLGTVFFISHDRTFVNTLAQAIIEVKDGRVALYPGSYADYVYHLEQDIDADL